MLCRNVLEQTLSISFIHTSMVWVIGIGMEQQASLVAAMGMASDFSKLPLDFKLTILNSNRPACLILPKTIAARNMVRDSRKIFKAPFRFQTHNFKFKLICLFDFA